MQQFSRIRWFWFAVAVATAVGTTPHPRVGRADPIMVTQAMKSSTIAEISIDADAVRVELEIGDSDRTLFANLMPDEIYQQLGRDPKPLAERYARFFAEDLPIKPDEFPPLAGRVLSVEVRQRAQRDEITGDERLPASADDSEQVVFARLEYPFEQRPDTLTFAQPKRASRDATANILFAVYHLGLPVADFRSLGGAELIELDWDDPWYSFFHNRNLRRQYDAPAMAFLYVEPFEVRQEIVIRPRDLQHWLDFELDGTTVLGLAQRAAIKQRVAEFLMRHNPVTINGQIAQPALDRIHFVRRTLRTTSVVDPADDVPLVSATLGVILVYPTSGLPENVSLAWDLFSPTIQRLPTIAIDESGGIPSTLSPTDPVLRWHNFLTNPTISTMASVPAPRIPFKLSIPVYSAVAVSLFLAAAAIGWPALAGRRRLPPGLLLALLVLLFVTVVTLPYGHARPANPWAIAPKLESTKSRQVVSALLRNVYRAFDRHEESLVYDRLSRSISGDLLAEVYLSVRQSMELANQGGARVKVKKVALLACDPRPALQKGQFSYHCTWTVSGDVGHWGHTHRRTKQYEALINIVFIDGNWKIIAMALLDERRIDNDVQTPSTGSP